MQSLLIKGIAPGSGSFGLNGTAYRVRPLFQSIGTAQGLGIAGGPAWYVVEPQEPTDDAHAWDACHQLVAKGFGITGTGIDYAEPNLKQQWIYGTSEDQALGIAAGCVAAPSNPAYPTQTPDLWYRDARYSDFDGQNVDGTGVRIAHLDTGYDPGHSTVPANLAQKLQHNFVDADTPDDATDVTKPGVLANIGHGTGTLSILAGKGVGAAVGASVVPIRVANSVILFENSAIAQAFDYVHKLCSDPATRVDVITMSMGGLASQAWADAVNALYDIGVFVVTAAGNNYANLPTRNVVYPARFHRVVAACGVMANHQPYADLAMGLMAGNYGPDSRMASAIAACTPNLPWAKIGCPTVVNWNGNGTSSATPQVAAAAALFIEAHRQQLDALPEPWMRVEAIREALFGSAVQANPQHFGNGTLDAGKAVARPVANAANLKKQPLDDVAFPVLRVLTGMGLTQAATSQQAMLELEALQLSQNVVIERLLPDPDVDPATLSSQQRAQIADALASMPQASQTLRDALGKTNDRSVHAMPNVNVPSKTDELHLRHACNPPIPQPEYRTLRIFASDPSAQTRLEMQRLNIAEVTVRWEPLAPGPVGEYIEVVDVDPASDACYAPVDLDDPKLVMQNGRTPSEGSAQFHQQMVYAVSMKTIEHFERALGRVALWSPHIVTTNGKTSHSYVQRLRIHPHALRAANAFYSPDKKALLFGYFSTDKQIGTDVPGTLVFGCLSYDIVAHETTHALLDGLHRRYHEATNHDMLAFHEAFADIVALFQHFTVSQAVRDQIAKTRGELMQQQSLLGQLAFQFGQAMGAHAGLRDYVGHYENDVWKPTVPKRTDYTSVQEAHARGALLVAAIFDAYLRIYAMRYEELARLATGGSGVLPEGNLPDPLVDQLADDASKLASQWLNICIRALDYCPPVDLTYGDYLRALVTADTEVVPDDKRGYRTALLGAFRDRGIYAPGVRNASPSSLVWEPPPIPLQNLGGILDQMSLSWDLHSDRSTAFKRSEDNAKAFHNWLLSNDVSQDEIDALGLVRLPRGQQQPWSLGTQTGTLHGIEVHSVRPARRVSPDGELRVDLIVEITQTWYPDNKALPHHRGGVTLVIGLDTREVRYFIRKKLDSVERFRQNVAFAMELADESPRGNYFTEEVENEPFELLHRLISQNGQVP